MMLSQSKNLLLRYFPHISSIFCICYVTLEVASILSLTIPLPLFATLRLLMAIFGVPFIIGLSLRIFQEK
jgi:hypothetical protein